MTRTDTSNGALTRSAGVCRKYLAYGPRQPDGPYGTARCRLEQIAPERG
ncbi:MAG TPA: hypothetical protein VNO82_12420 [Solirubrobacteraceae bacterium]|nr:hypothetical protein [Solirubrobacteraceae bacterium]